MTQYLSTLKNCFMCGGTGHYTYNVSEGAKRCHWCNGTGKAPCAPVCTVTYRLLSADGTETASRRIVSTGNMDEIDKPLHLLRDIFQEDYCGVRILYINDEKLGLVWRNWHEGQSQVRPRARKGTSQN
jgi:hypothetical protein